MGKGGLEKSGQPKVLTRNSKNYSFCFRSACTIAYIELMDPIIVLITDPLAALLYWHPMHNRPRRSGQRTPGLPVHRQR